MSSMVVRSSFTEKDLERWFDENRITEIECLVPDLAGVARGKILPREKFTEDRGMRVPEDVLAMTVNGDKPGDDPRSASWRNGCGRWASRALSSFASDWSRRASTS